MQPTYEELIALNPLLQKKSRMEIDELVVTILDCGYVWDTNKKIFYNPNTSNSIRTMGLDVFNPNSFKEMHNSLNNEMNIDPYLYHKEGQAFGYLRKYSLKLIILLLINLLIGWLVFSIIEWAIINITLFLIIIFLFARHNYYAKKKEEMIKKYG
jgi:hypothetical protein